MHFKLLIAFMDTDVSEAVIKAARDAGATGATLINQARGEGMQQTKTFLGLTLEAQRDVIVFMVEEHLSRHILEKIDATVNQKPGSGIVVQIDVEDAIGVTRHIKQLIPIVEENL